MSAEPGFIYRVAHAGQAQLQALIKAYVGEPGWAFGGAAQWDLDLSGQRDKRDNLRPIAAFADSSALDLSGDFGHAFSAKAELRWKRRDDGAYDLLVLSEERLDALAGLELRVPHQNSQTGEWAGGEWTTHRPKMRDDGQPPAILQTGGHAPVSYIEYRAPNGAVLFQRLVRVGS